MDKKYGFNEILKEYNEIYKHHYKLSPEINNAVIVHVIAGARVETNVFYVTYLKEGDGGIWERKPLIEFTYCYISSSISNEYIQDIILSKEEEQSNLKIEIWPPSKIRYAYLHTNYYQAGIGILGKSCMRSKEMQKSLNFYTKNKARIVVVVGKNHKIHARALLWDNVKNTYNKKIITYLDRVYARSDVLLHLFHKLAEENKWGYYNSTSAGKAKSHFYKDGLDITDICHFPYTDTFRYLYYKDNFVSSSVIPSKVKYKDDIVTLTTVENGGYVPCLDPNRVIEVLTGNYISKKDAVFVKRYEGHVLKINIVNINGDYYSSHDVDVASSELDGYILKKDAVKEFFTNDTINKTIAIHSVDYNGYIHKSNAIIIKNKTYHKNDTNIVCFNGNWYHISQCFVNYDREKKNNGLEKQQPMFWVRPNEYFLPSYIPYPDSRVTSKEGLIPKDCAIIAYNLIYNPQLNDIEYQEVYLTTKTGLIQLITGELIISSQDNRKYIKKFNGKYYLKREFKPPDKNQLLLLK